LVKYYKMSKHHSLLTATHADELYSQLIELYGLEISLTERLLRCRQVMENLYKTLTVNSNIAFTGLYARMQYVQEVSPVPGELVEQLQLLRLLTNKVVHKDDVDFGEQDFNNSVKVLADAISHFGAKAIPPELKALLELKKARNFQSFHSIIDQTIEHIFGTVNGWKSAPPNDSRKFVEIRCQTPDGIELTITLWDKSDRKNPCQNWTLLEKALWKYCNISFYNLSAVQGVTNRYQSTPQTIVVLEPDFLVDVSSVADCFQNKDCYPELFILNRFFSEPITAALAKGKCVNHIFDEFVTNPAKPLKEILQDYLRDNPQQVFALGKETWAEIFSQIELDHLQQLKEVGNMLATQNCQLEPSFISLRYGLHGRLDVITLPDSTTPKYSILELKSGSAPHMDVWKSHQMQVVGYNLIMKEIFGAGNIANSSIFYSRSSETPLRHVVNHITQEQDFLMCRNRIIGLMQKMATQPEEFINWLKTGARDYANQFITEKANRVSNVLKSLSEFEINWFAEKLRFIFREIWAVKTGAFVENETVNYGFSSLWNCSLAEKKQQYRILDSLWIDNIAEDIITFHRQDDNTLTNLRVGDIVLMYKQDIPINEQQLIRGTILALDNEKVQIRTRSNLKKEGVFDNYTLWSVESDLMESSLYSGISSVFTCLSAEPEIRAKLLGCTAPEFADLDLPESLSWRKDISDSLRGMIRAKDYYLVQGPPGTGKTSCLLMQYVQHTLSETQNKMLLLSFTNRAVDEICANLEKEQVKFIRLGSYRPVNGKKPAAKARTLSKKAVYASPETDYDNSRVFVSTVSSFLAAAPDLLNKITIDEMVVDEASQIMEHYVIGLMARIRKTILIGDQNQLPPIILQQTDKGKESILEKFIRNADKKIFPSCYSMLTYHYRMHRDIAELVIDNYNKRLEPNSTRQLITKPWLETQEPLLQTILSSRIVWIDTIPSFQSKADPAHAKWIRQFLDLLACHIPPDEIGRKVGVISPFRAQAQCIISALGNIYKDITVDTVERYQGSERDCIIMTYPVKFHHELTMLQSINALGTVDRKLNVALSRAREQLIILGSSKILTHSEFFHKVYAIIKKQGLIISGKDIGVN
jgi:DNA replication ATP-dependent helicase Dna2